MLAEHVWEHLTEEEGLAAARACFKYLSPGGFLRVVVPDGLHPDPAYVEWSRLERILR
jgi:predicted SAM-dependent methyltransferase